MKFALSFFCMLFCATVLHAQEFSFTCFHPLKKDITAYYFNTAQNIYDDLGFENRIAFKNSNDSCGILQIKPLAPFFIQITTDNFLVIPGAKVTGSYNVNKQGINITDTGSANFILSGFVNGLVKIKSSYAVGSSYETFKKTFLQAKSYFDSSLTALNSYQALRQDAPVKAALAEFYYMQFAHFLVYPVMFKNQFNPTDLRNKIESSIKIRIPDYWFQTQAGRIFLRTYFSKLVLPQAGFNAENAFKNKYFTEYRIKKYLWSFYFDECILSTAAGIGQQKLRAQLSSFRTSFRFTADEYKKLDEIASRLKNFYSDITQLFCTQELEDLDGHLLTYNEKKKLIEGANVIFDYWASWCGPCKEKLSTLTSDKISKDQKQYNLIFISTDVKRNEWLADKYSYHNKENCFRLADKGENDFIKNLQIAKIPRYILINNSKLISDDFSF